MSYVHEVQTVYDVVQNPQMILLCEKGVHGDSATSENVTASREGAVISSEHALSGCCCRSRPWLWEGKAP